MAGKNTAVFGIYRNRAGVERAVDALKAAEFRNSDISVLFPENTGTKDFAHEKETKAPEGATAGAGTGALLGGGLGWLAGIGALARPGAALAVPSTVTSKMQSARAAGCFTPALVQIARARRC